MTTFTLNYDDGSQVHSEEHETERPAQVGETYVFQGSCRSLGGRDFKHGDKLKLIEKTVERPHQRWCSLGNFVVEHEDGHRSVWSTIDWLVAIGYLKLAV